MKKSLLFPALITVLTLSGCSLGTDPGVGPSIPPIGPGSSESSSETPPTSSVDSGSLDVGETINDTMTTLLLENGVHLTADIDKLNISDTRYVSEYEKNISKQELSGNAEIKFNGLKEKDVNDFSGEAHLSDVSMNTTLQFIENNLVIDEQNAAASSMSANAYLKESTLYFDLNQNVFDFISSNYGQTLPFSASDKFFVNNIFNGITLENNLSAYGIFGLNYIDLANDDLYLDFIDEIYLTGTMYNFKMVFDTEEFLNQYVVYLLEYESIRADEVDTLIATFSDILDIDAEVILGLDLENLKMVLDIDAEVSVTAPYEKMSYDVDATLSMQFGDQTINYPNLNEYNVDFANPQ